jgi:tetratricopeptide (TPR) repeat protein/predicted Ser/Thr protein kinase
VTDPDDSIGATEEVAPHPAKLSLARGTCIDRYIVVDQLGAGGMGVVYKAFDPELGRPVALKLLKTEHAGGLHRDRLLREAQALARLSHPNVVAVHDVGTFKDDVFVAMEFVEGVTLRAWLAAERRSQRQILEVFAAAGEGLQAAHRAGLVHRDFKPDNVIIGKDGRVRVLDFGLARATATDLLPAEEDAPSSPETDSAETVGARPSGARPSSQPETPDPHESGRLLASPMTRAGSVMGTPRYMAPEQHRGEKVDEKADQFSFCVALYEALHGAPPYDVRLIMRDSRHEWRISEPPAGARVSRWLRQVLVRGLAVEPAARHASMEVLLASLRADPTLARRRRVGALALVVTLGAGALGWRLQVRHQASLCRSAEGKLAGVWDETRRSAVRAAFLGSHTPYAESVLRTVEHAFDQYSRAWVAMQIDACEDTRVRREEPQEVLDQRTACLDDRLLQLKTLVDVYATADAKVVEGAGQSARSLPSLDRCADKAALRAARPPRDAETRQRVDGVRTQLAHANALGLAARYEPALQVARAALADAQKVDYVRVQAEAELQLARLLDGHGDFADSMKTYHQALVSAVAAHDDESAASATIGLTNETGLRLSHFEEADRWAALAESQVRQLQHQDEQLGVYYSKRSSLRRSESRYDEALADANKALEILERVKGPDDFSVADAEFARAGIQRFRAKIPEALAGYQRAIAILKQTLGPDHPMLASNQIGLADVYGENGEHERAIAEYRLALATIQRVQPDHPLVALIHNDLGSEMFALDRPKEGFDEFEQALNLWKKELGPSQETTIGNNNLGEAKLALDQPAEALEYLTQALELCGKGFGSSHLCGVIHRNMGESFRRLHRLDEAMSRFQSSLTMMEKALGAKHPELVATLLGIGQVELARHQASSAAVTLERALTIREASTSDGVELAEIRFVLGKARWDSGAHDAGRALAIQAQEAYAKAAGQKKSLEEVSAWLARHR